MFAGLNAPEIVASGIPRLGVLPGSGTGEPRGFEPQWEEKRSMLTESGLNKQVVYGGSPNHGEDVGLPREKNGRVCLAVTLAFGAPGR